MAISTISRTGAWWWCCSVFAEMYAVRPTTEPTLRSMFRVRTTIVSPTATTATIATSVPMSCQLPMLRKLWARAPNSTMHASKATKMPSSRRRKAASASAVAVHRVRFTRQPPSSLPPPR